MRIRTLTVGCAAIALVTGFATAHAQDTGQDGVAAPDAGTEMSQCAGDMAALGEQMRQDGYWLSGWSGYGVAAPGTAVDPTAPGAAGVTDPAMDPALQQEMAATGAAGPWGETGWTTDPRYEIRTLYSAAAILDRRGDEEGCQAVLGEVQEVYDHYVSDLAELGVEPGEVQGWRQEQILAATPVSELGSALRVDEIIGTELRNPQDEYLGEVDDVILDPEDGSIRYVAVSRGGFLGIGADTVAVRWDDLRVTAGMNSFVLPAGEQAIENAPAFDADAYRGGEQFQAALQEVDAYWDETLTTGDDNQL